jgi:hypothetical protein
VRQDPTGATEGDGLLPAFDTGTPSAARMWNYWIGGQDNFRAAGNQPGRHRRPRPELLLRCRPETLELDARAHDDGALARNPEGVGGVSGDP